MRRRRIQKDLRYEPFSQLWANRDSALSAIKNMSPITHLDIYQAIYDDDKCEVGRLLIYALGEEMDRLEETEIEECKREE